MALAAANIGHPNLADHARPHGNFHAHPHGNFNGHHQNKFHAHPHFNFNDHQQHNFPAHHQNNFHALSHGNFNGHQQNNYHAPAPVYHAPAPAYKPAHHANSYHEPAYDTPAHYEYGYAVADDYSGANFEQHENRDGYATNGEYRVNLPDGRTQIVTYSVGDAYTGYVADVRYEGEAQYPHYEPKPYEPRPSYHAPRPSYHEPKPAPFHA